MIVEERRGNMGMDGGSKDQFPVGMRVLAVDDDPTCLKLLETLLRRCQYHVTTTNQAITALKLLRENKDQFDLVISDVHMPDMDGFKLLELVGLEMDLPVIMLSANDDTKAVMRGITHGAVDYLLKPVRIEQLRNIWQHVIRRKKLDRRGHSNNDNEEDNEKPRHTNSKGSNESLDQCGKLNKKRKDQNEEDEDGCDDNAHDSDDPSSQKKPRVVWSVGLHCKFVAAVNQLGIDKAVPKRILDLMNVEKLTRENVASHLQKYRLYLKRLNAMATQQANMVAALGGRDLSNLPMGPFDGFGNFPALEAAGHAPSFSSYQSNSGILNATRPTGLGLQGLARSGMVQFDRTPDINTTYPINDIHRNQHGTLLHGVPTISELDNFQQFKRIPEVSSGLSGEPANSFSNVTDTSILLQAQKQFVQSTGFVPTVSSDPFEMGTGASSYLPDLGRFNDSWQGVVPLSGYTTKTFPTDSAFTHNGSAQRNTRAHATPIISEMGIGGGSNILNFRSIGSSRHEEPIEGPSHERLVFGSSSSPPLFRHPVIDPIGEGQRMNDGFYNKMVDRNIIGNTNFSAPFIAQGCKVVRSTADAQAKADYISDISRIQGGLSSSGCGLNDLVNGMIKQEKDDFTFVDGDMGCDVFPLGACM